MARTEKLVMWVLLCVAAVVTTAGILATRAAFDEPAEHSVAIAGLGDEGLDAAVALAAALTTDLNMPVVPALFMLTVRVDNPSMVFSGCVTRDATAAVVAEGAVPEFCAGRGGGEGEVAVPVWPADLDAARRTMPPAGAVVDVAVRMPRVRVGRHGFYSGFALACKVVVGGGLSLCNGALSMMKLA